MSTATKEDRGGVSEGQLFRADVVSAEIQVPVSQPEEEGQET